MTRIACTIVEVCAFRRLNGRAEFLLLQRAPEEKIYPGIWQMVSGSIQDGERAVDAAIREFREETALHPLRLWVVPHVSTFYDPDYDATNLSPLFAAEVASTDVLVLSEEHQRHEWLSYEQARTRLVWPGQRQGLDIVNSYIVGGEEAERLTRVPLP